MTDKAPVLPPCPAGGWRDTAITTNRCVHCNGWGATTKMSNLGVARRTCPKCLGKGHR